jgi:hypothetical protein
VGGAIERSVSPAPTIRVVAPEAAQQVASAGDSQALVEERRPDPSPSTRAEQLEGSRVEDEVTAEAGIVDRSSL